MSLSAIAVTFQVNIFLLMPERPFSHMDYALGPGGLSPSIAGQFGYSDLKMSYFSLTIAVLLTVHRPLGEFYSRVRE